MINLRQKELHEWQVKNFGKHEDDIDRSFTGMVEEIGELAHAILKYKQRIREYGNGAKNFSAKQKFLDDITDARGDIVIYGLQLMTEFNIDAQDAIEKESYINSNSRYLLNVIENNAGVLALYTMIYNYTNSNIRTTEFVKHPFIIIYYTSKQLLEEYGIDADVELDKTINKVLKRDWTKKPDGNNIDGDAIDYKSAWLKLAQVKGEHMDNETLNIMSSIENDCK